MTALRSAGLSEAFADRRTAAGVMATLALPVAFLSFVAHASLGQLDNAFFLSPPVVIVAVVAAGFLYAVSNSAFSAATLRRRARYELMSSVGARKEHIAKVLLWELGLPALVGIGGGLVVGVVAAELFQPFNESFGLPETGGSGWGAALGVLSTVVFVGVPAVTGVWAAARSSAERVGEVRTGERRNPTVDIERLGGLGIKALVFSVPVLLFSVLAFSFSSRFRFLAPLEGSAWFGLIVGVVGSLAGVVLLVPSLFALLADRLPDRGVASALKGLASNPQRAAGFTGAVVALTTLTVMSAAGILSDQGQFDDPGDRRQIVASRFLVENGDLEDVAARHGNAVLGAAEFSALSGPFFEDRFVTDDLATSSFDTAGLTDDLIALLELEEGDVEFARQGGLLLDSDVIGEVVVLVEGDSSDDVPFPRALVETRRIRRGGGFGQAGPASYAFLDDPPVDLMADSGFSVAETFLVRFAEPMSQAMIDELRDRTDWLELPQNHDEDAAIGVLLLGLVGGLLFSLAIAGSNLAAVELEDEFATLVALGRSPNVRPKTLAAQLAWQLGVGVAVGSGLGVLLFWVVTRGDPSVPNAIVPLGAIAVLSIAALAAVALVGLLHGPAEPAVSSRVSATVEV